ncbi:hypothetical protein PanWU01x14_002530 [Parasponia andersonii]|uniref:Uncharacterized protein n=1 Tax=Parasponia andersonii TaxID=3476 RepID=A0A2P5E568_PARAD|nr:hypothetical protein PanWU01x14_002530 [Parasponia andersonii]
MARESVRRGMSCAIKCLPADLIKNHTMGITSRNKILADSSRKHTKRNELRNKMLASRPHQKSYDGNHIV